MVERMAKAVSGVLCDAGDIVVAALDDVAGLDRGLRKLLAQRDEARQLLGLAASRINVAGPVHERIDVLRRELTEYGQAAEARADRLLAALERLEQIYNTDKVAHLEAREIERIFDEHIQRRNVTSQP